MKGTAQSIATGEVLKIHEVDKGVPGDAYYGTINLIGEDDTHYGMKLL